jgi:hypothetical protein
MRAAPPDSSATSPATSTFPATLLRLKPEQS